MTGETAQPATARFAGIDGLRAARCRIRARLPRGTALGLVGEDGLQRWALEVPGIRDVRIRSTADGSEQPALWPPPSGWGPLLVVVHSLSDHFTQHLGIVYANWARQAGRGLMAPYLRGINDKPEAACSELAVQDVADAIDFRGSDPSMTRAAPACRSRSVMG
jgi:hypothetical protein